jgi:DNA (cytosine-5)-methyltransferase 1
MKKNTKDTGYYTVNEGSKGARIWLDGNILRRHGFTRGVNYIRELSDDQRVLRLRVANQGKYVVSGKSKAGDDVPVIDLQSKEISKLTHGMDTVRVDFDNGCISISISHLAAAQIRREARFAQEVKKGEISEATLCVGVGMATLALKEGFERHGLSMRTDYVVDRESTYLDLAMRNNRAIDRRTRILKGSLEEIEPSLITETSIVQLSLPCTGQSLSGRSKLKLAAAEMHPTDATAIYGVMNLLSSMNAAIYISENVKAAQKSTTYELLRKTLTILGYHIHEFVLGPEQSGSVERRERYWMLAVSTGLPQPDTDAIPVYPRRYRSIAEALDPIPDDSPMWSDNTYLKEKARRDLAAGKGFSRSLVTPADTAVTVLNKSYAKRQSTPSMLVRPHIDDKERLFTPAEQARFKDCDPALVDGASFTLATEVLGQGIDMPQARGIAEMLADRVVRGLLPVNRQVQLCLA